MNRENIPVCITSPIDLSIPNERIPIYEGLFTLKYKGGDCSVEGEIYYSWFPTNCAKFICQMPVYPKGFDTFKSFEIWINGILFSAEATVSESSHGVNFIVKGQCKDGAVLVMKLMQMHIAYNEPEEANVPDTDILFSREEQECLTALNRTTQGKTEALKNPFTPGKLNIAVWILARIGGWKGYTSQRKPGMTTMFRGLTKFYDIYDGWNLHKDVGTR